MKNSRPNILVIQADQLAAKYLDYQTCLVGKMHFVGADKVCSKWAYQDIVGYRFPKE